MREDLLHFIWKYKKLQLIDLFTTHEESVVITDVGLHNHLSGPDFFNAKLIIDGQLWAGNVEIHVKASDWYAHRHEENTNYDNVILHVVWEDDCAIFRKDGSEIPTLALKSYISNNILNRYNYLFDKSQKTFINCEKDIEHLNDFVFQNWLERLYFERLHRKSAYIFSLLEDSKNDWEQVLFMLLFKNFGLKINGEAFESLAKAIDFKTVRKLQDDILKLESVFFGMSHLLNDGAVVTKYYLELKEEYQFIKHKFELNDVGVLKPDFFKLRPPNFPTIRLSQLANLFGLKQNLFTEIIQANTIDALYKIFDISASHYWNDHYTFGKSSKKSPKKLTKKFIDLLIINTILPLKFCHAKHHGNDVNEIILRIIKQIKTEENSIITNFKNHKVIATSAQDSQAILELYNTYCTKNKCMQCAVGTSLLSGND